MNYDARRPQRNFVITFLFFCSHLLVFSFILNEKLYTQNTKSTNENDNNNNKNQ